MEVQENPVWKQQVKWGKQEGIWMQVSSSRQEQVEKSQDAACIGKNMD